MRQKLPTHGRGFRATGAPAARVNRRLGPSVNLDIWRSKPAYDRYSGLRLRQRRLPRIRPVRCKRSVTMRRMVEWLAVALMSLAGHALAADSGDSLAGTW